MENTGAKTDVLAGFRICVVEDDKFFRELLEKKLTNAGAFVGFSENGENALELVKQTEWNLIILDLMLPGMDGFEFLRERKNDPKSALIPVMILSNFGEPEQIETAKKLGVKTYLIKAAVNMNTVVDEVVKILSRNK